MLATWKSIMLGRRLRKKARVDFPEKGTTPESGGGTATMSRFGRDSRKRSHLCRSQPPRRLCKREPGHPSGPTAVARARAQAIPGKPPAMTEGSQLLFRLRWTRDETATCGSGKADIPVRQPFDPPPGARLLGTALANDQKQSLKPCVL